MPDTFIPVQYFIYLDKIEHAIAYALLGFLFFWALKTRNKGPVLVFFLSIICCSLYGGLIEILQGFASRTTDPVDWLFDFIGATIGTGFGWVVYIISKSLRNKSCFPE
ncbi:MAG: VanZ family protein [Spirochaetia bacterium]